jgi:transposase
MQKQVGKKGKSGPPSRYDVAFMRAVAREYQTSDLSVNQLARKYGLSHSLTEKWITKFSLELRGEDLTLPPMTPEEQRSLEALQKQNEQLLRKLELAHLKITGLELMIDVAEQELQVDIRKKSGTKQSPA